MDEPTTGLDSAAAAAVMKRIQVLAREGRTIVCSIHQPSPEVFDRFDKLLLLSRGQVMYVGPAKAAIRFFDSLGITVPRDSNPADFFLDQLNDDFEAAVDLKLVHTAYAESEYAQELEERLESSRHFFEEHQVMSPSLVSSPGLSFRFSSDECDG